MIVAVVWSASILIPQNNDPSRFDFLTDEQIEYVKGLDSLCSNFSATSKMTCNDTIEAEVFKYQVENASEKAVELGDVSICHLISSDVDCLFQVAKKSNNVDACYAITESDKKYEDSEEENKKYLKGLQEYCLTRFISS